MLWISGSSWCGCPMANKKNLRLAVAALRSEEFTQGQGVLKRRNTINGKVSHCCLGVFCEIAMRHGVQLEVTEFEMKTEGATGYRFNGAGSQLPLEVADWLGIPTSPQVTPTKTAMSANDALGWNFGQIADAFDSYYGLNEDDGDTPGTD